MDYKFNVVKNGLDRASAIKSLKLENEYYNITAFYDGDYRQDYENKAICEEKIAVVCKPKIDNIDLNWGRENTLIELKYVLDPYPHMVDDLIRRLEIAKECAIELKETINFYFPAKNV